MVSVTVSSAASLTVNITNDTVCKEGQSDACAQLELNEAFAAIPCTYTLTGAAMYCGPNENTLSERCRTLLDINDGEDGFDGGNAGEVGESGPTHHVGTLEPFEWTTVVLGFTPENGGEYKTYRWTKPQGEGRPMRDTIVLTEGKTYVMTVDILNELESPPGTPIPGIDDRSDQHQFLFKGFRVSSPASGEMSDPVIRQDYADMDENGLPVGLENTVVALASGRGEMVVELRRMPPRTKMAGLAESTQDGDSHHLPGYDGLFVDDDTHVELEIKVEATE